MRIALIMENSQASKNELVYNTLKSVAEPLGHTVLNFGMKDAEDVSLTYVQNGLLAAVLLNTKVCDFVITGCGTGEGAMLALNSFPGVLCGYVVDPSDAFMFREVNDGNAIALPFAKGFGWGAEINLAYVFEKLLSTTGGNGYPKERVIPEQRNKKILDHVKTITHNSMINILKNLDQEFVEATLNRPSFKEYFALYAEDGEVKEWINKNVAK